MEATIALSVFTIGMLGLGGAFSQIIAANTVSRQKQICTFLAERQMSRLRLAKAGELDQTNGAFEPPWNDYTWQAQIVCRSSDPDLMDVWITVRYQSGTESRLWSQIVVADAQQ